MPLAFMKPGDSGVVRRVGGSDEVKRFLANLGFVDGSQVTVVSEIHGDLIVNVKDSSRILPGHGGVLDRLDSISFCVGVYAVASALYPFFAQAAQ